MEVVDNVPVINFHNGITVTEVPLDVVAVLVVSVRDAMFLVVLATSLTLGGVVLVVMVVDALTQVVVLVDLSVVDVGSCRVVARLGVVGRVVLAQLLGLRGSHM